MSTSPVTILLIEDISTVQFFVRNALSSLPRPYTLLTAGSIAEAREHMGAHTMDLLWNSIDAGVPTGIEVDTDVSDKYDPNICPVKLKVTFDHPANSWRGPIQVVWYQGGLKPPAPKGYVDFARVGNGAIFEGT